VANAISDALSSFDVAVDRLPASPARILELLGKA
jgi:hypothetical protein